MEKTFMDELDRNIFPYVEYPGYPFRYPTHLPLIVSRKQIEELRRVSGALYHIFAKAVKRAQDCGDDFMDAMEIPAGLRKYLHQGNAMKDLPTWISRFDYVIDEKTGQIRMVEINADTPCAEIEAYYANGVAGRYFGKENPNAFEMNGLRSFMLDVYLRCCGNMNSRELEEHPILFSCFDDYIEDLGTTKFLMNAMKEAVPEDVRSHILFESFYRLAVMEDGSPALPDGRKVSFLYRMHPMEILIEERADQDGSSLGELMMDGYINHRFHMMNPPESIIMQSKAFQALLYALMEEHAFFNEKEQEIIRTYIPECFFQRDFRLEGKDKNSLWIRKPVWGREGRGIDIINGNGETVYRKKVEEEEDIVCRNSESCLIQQYIPQQKIVTKTDVGIMEGYVTLSCFMLGDRPSAVYARFSDEKIAGNEAYWIPVLYE
ncbi:glutathionylspermidine synthase family protein [Dialister sp.]|uniref:glutathionylspermidine synthase family protein n=1 Tax=Dialister sp. TaxID=1955814 RepID=UPI003EFF915A